MTQHRITPAYRDGYSAGYADAFLDLLDAVDEGGLERLGQWIKDNARAEQQDRAGRLLATLTDLEQRRQS